MSVEDMRWTTADVMRVPAVPTMDENDMATKSEMQGPSLAGESFVSVKTLARQWDCSRTTVSRLLEQAGVPAYYFGRGRNGSKRYRKVDIDRYLAQVESG